MTLSNVSQISIPRIFIFSLSSAYFEDKSSSNFSKSEFIFWVLLKIAYSDLALSLAV